MTSTSDDRREVARRLRSVTKQELRYVFLEEILNYAVGGRCLDSEGDIDERLILNRLADLIDPTCHVVRYLGLNSDDEREYERACGSLFKRPVEEIMLYYCPWCG